VAREHEVDVPAVQQVVEGADVRPLEIDPGEDRRVAQLPLQVLDTEAAVAAIGGVEADALEGRPFRRHRPPR